jgi:DNA-binding transcriptional LysR family regulator
LSLHQLRCFLATYEHGSLTAAAEQLGYAQPSISEQVRSLEKTIGMPLFRRVGRGMVPTTVADTLRPHAERTLAEAAEALRVARSVSALETGTIRFGMFGSARLYTSTALVVEVLRRHPGVRVELVGQNSSDVLEDIRRGRIEAALIALPQVTSEGIEVTPVARDELVYVSADPERVQHPVSAVRIGQAQLVMAETTWRDVDSTRVVLRQMLHAAGQNPRTRIEVEDIETAIELVGLGLADSVVPRAAAAKLLPQLAPKAGMASLRPRQYDVIGIVHRAGANLSVAAQLMIEIATREIRAVAEPVGA